MSTTIKQALERTEAAIHDWTLGATTAPEEGYVHMRASVDYRKGVLADISAALAELSAPREEGSNQYAKIEQFVHRAVEHANAIPVDRSTKHGKQLVESLSLILSHAQIGQMNSAAHLSGQSAKVEAIDPAILHRIIEKWGREAQVHKIQEEALELALILNQRKCATKDPDAMEKALYDELADMTIMMAQARILFHAPTIDERVAYKLRRVQEKHPGGLNTDPHA